MRVKYKDKDYHTIEAGKMKQIDGTWVDAVVYENSASGQVYIRSLEDFLNKFEYNDELINVFHFALGARLNVEFNGKRYRALGYNYEDDSGILADSDDKVLLINFNLLKPNDKLKVVY